MAKKSLLVMAGGLALSGAGLVQAQDVGNADAMPLAAEAAQPAAVPASTRAPAAPGKESTLPSVAVAPATESPQPPPARAGGSRLIEEVIVTAQKREESIKDVPISISAFSEEQLSAKQVLNATDLPKITPGLTISTLAGLTAVFLRGVGSDASILGDPLVVTYVDNVYFPSGFGQLQDFGPIDGIEVLKGPQGTLFGRNALGGAIRIKSKDPLLDQFEGSASAEYGSFNRFKGKAYVSVPLGDTLAIAASGLYSRGDSHIDGRDTPKLTPLPKEKQDSLRVKLLWKPADWMDLRLNYYDFSSDGTGTYAVNTQPTVAGSLAGIRAEDPRHGANDETVQKPVDVRTYFGQVSFYLPFADVKVFGSDQKLLDQQSVDFDGSKLPIAVFQARGFSNAKTAELQILSNEDTPIPDWLQGIAGVYYFRALAGFEPAVLFAGGTDITRGIIGGIEVPQGILDTINAAFGNAPIPQGAVFRFNGNILTDSIAYYAQATATVTDWFSVTLGGRYQDEKRTVDDSSAGVALLNGERIVYQAYSGYDDPRYRGATKNFDPKISLNFKPDWAVLGDSPLLYVSYQTATTSLTFNAINILDAPERVEATEIEAYEAGIKTRLFDRLVDLNAAVFNYDITNPQVQTISLLAGGAVRFENAESQRIRGAEFDTLIQVLPSLTDGSLIFTAGATYLDAKYTSFKDGSGFDETTGLYQDGLDFTGNRIVRSPKLSATAGLLKTFSTSTGPLEVGIDYYYNSGFSYLAQGTPNASEAKYDTWGASVSYLYEPWDLRVSGFGRNLLNEDYNLSRFVNDFGTLDIVAPGRTYGVELSVKF